ncbi:MAG TPA: sugar phosphate nucleotidyltransferase, partial [Sedimentisphaerales bacterium]|nr:sugar phosphate nucleotidyltransferase [Sedimentisphaerales bacterium]
MQESKSIAQQTMVVILAAGKGTRMGNSDFAKVCFEIDSVPAINRTIATFKQAGFMRFLLVVGSRAQHVLDTVTRDHPDVIYVNQSPQLGTGHAAKIVAEVLQDIDYKDNILVTLGDKYIESEAINALIEGHIKQNADMSLITVPRTKVGNSSGGRILMDKSGQALDIIEKPDISKQAIIDQLKLMVEKKRSIKSTDLTKLINEYFPSQKKQKQVVPQLLALAKNGEDVNVPELKKLINSKQYNLQIAGQFYTAEKLEKLCTQLNPSLYLFKANAFYRAVSMIDNNNAQSEYYLTDVVRHLSSIKDQDGKNTFRVRTVAINNPDWLQAFNSPDELLAIQDYVRRKKQSKAKTAVSLHPALGKKYCTVTQWLSRIENNTSGVTKWLKEIYGPHIELHQEKIKTITKVLNTYGREFGFEQKVCIIRAPRRLNLMGRHVDHRGGFNNFLAFDRETIIVAGLRDDDNVIAINTEPVNFKKVQFNIAELIGRFAWSDWLNFVNSDWVRNMLYNTAGHWGNYIKASVLRFQHYAKDIKINGMNMAVTGNIPIAAGLSSSSTLVVGTLQAAIALNNFQLESQQFIDLCGQGEWFVGSRGGSGDHAAIYLGKRGKLTQVGYMPFRIIKTIDAPKKYVVIIANSHLKAAKSGFAKDTFNTRVASYNLGLALLKHRCPEIADSLEYVRDIDPQHLGCKTSDIYRMLLKVPQKMTRKELISILPKDCTEMMETTFANHTEPGFYNLRSVLLFGASEVARSRMCMDYFEKGLINDFGKLMNISHDGDRVSIPGEDGKYKKYIPGCSDEYLNTLINDLASEDPQKVLNAQLYNQPGGYYCSMPQIDQMVDIACSVKGVAGAQLAGAGLGGCIMIFAEKDALENIKSALNEGYYKPNKLKPDIIPC